MIDRIHPSRRHFLCGATAGAGLLLLPGAARAGVTGGPHASFRMTGSNRLPLWTFMASGTYTSATGSVHDIHRARFTVPPGDGFLVGSRAGTIYTMRGDRVPEGLTPLARFHRPRGYRPFRDQPKAAISVLTPLPPVDDPAARARAATIAAGDGVPGRGIGVGVLDAPADLRPPTALPDHGPVRWDPKHRRVLVRESGAVVEGLNLAGAMIHIRPEARDVTVRNCRVDYTGSVFGIRAEGPGAVIEHCEVFTRPGGPHAERGGTAVLLRRDATVRRSVIRDTLADGIAFRIGEGQDCLIEENVIRTGGFATGAHCDAIQMTAGCEGTVIRRNWIDNRCDTHASVFGSRSMSERYKCNVPVYLNADRGAIREVLIAENIITGGVFQMAAIPEDGHVMRDIVVRDNAFFSHQLQFGVVHPRSDPRALVVSGNYDAQSGVLLGL